MLITYYVNILSCNAGIIETIYEYRNDITECVREKDYDVDFIAMVFTDKNYISYRRDVSEIAKHYGGYGHKAAASSPITEEEKSNILKYFCK